MLGMTNYLTDFRVLVNVCKNVLCLQCWFKSWRDLRDIDCDYDIK